MQRYQQTQRADGEQGGGQSGTRPVMPMRNAPENGEKAGGEQRRCEARGIVPGQQPTQQLAAQGGGPVIQRRGDQPGIAGDTRHQPVAARHAKGHAEVHRILVFPRVMANHIRQIMINLLDNSIKYNKHGGSVTFSSKTKPLDNGRALFCFSVSDTGIGMTS